MMGYAFGRLKEAIIIAAGLSVRNLFINYHQSRLEFYKGKFGFAKGLMCDFESILWVYLLWKRKQREWNEMVQNECINRGEMRRMERQWAAEIMVDIKKLREMENIVMQIEYRLKNSCDILVSESDFSNDNTIPNVSIVLQLS